MHLNNLILIYVLLILFADVAAQNCETARMEGYRGTRCALKMIASPDGNYVYTSDGTSIKKWDFTSNVVVADWPITGGMELFYHAAADGRYLRYGDMKGNVKLFDTQSGENIQIENYGVHAIFPGNIALIDEWKDYSRKLMLYDMATGQVKTTLEKVVKNKISVAENAKRIAWRTDKEVKVYDVANGKVIYSQKVEIYSLHPELSANGQYVGYCGKVIELSTKRIIPIACHADNHGDNVIFSSDAKSVYYLKYGNYQNQYYYVAKLLQFNIENGSTIGDYTEAWARPTYTNEVFQNYQLSLHPDGEQFFVLTPKKVVLSHKADFNKQLKSMDLFGIIGAAGLAQEKAKSDRADYIAGLVSKAKIALAEMQPPNVKFRQGDHNFIYDYDVTNNLLFIGSVFEAGIFSLNDKKFLKTYSLSFERPGLSVKINSDYGLWSMAPGGNLIAHRIGKGTNLYSRTGFIRGMQEIAVLRLFNEKLALALNTSNKIGLYDLDQHKFIQMYGTLEEEAKFELSPDKSKLVILRGSMGKQTEVYDVNTGKLIRELPKYSFPIITDKYLISFQDQKLVLTETLTGRPVELTGWDNTKAGRNTKVIGNHLLTWGDDGIMNTFDLSKMQYVNSQPVILLGNPVFANFAYFPNSDLFFILNDQGSAGYGYDGPEKNFASAYAVNVKSGDIKPYLFHINGKEAAEIAAKVEASRPPIDPCLHWLKIKPFTDVENTKENGRLYRVQTYDCNSQIYKLEYRMVLNKTVSTYTMDVPKYTMDNGDYRTVQTTTCPVCKGHGAELKTINYSNTNVDNYNVYVPGGKVVTTTSGSYQQTEVCERCHGDGIIKQY